MTTVATPVHYVLTNSEAGSLEFPNSNANVQEQQTLTNIYESHARIYPNPRLNEERLQRDRLISEIQKELDEASKEKEKDRIDDKPRKRGIFSYLFGKPSEKKVSIQSEEGTRIKEEDYIIYENIRDTQSEKGGESLCGTKTMLDLDCIPREAHSLARLHLSSPPLPIEISGDGPPLLVLDIGVIAELSPSTGKWQTRCTSDKSELERYLFQRRGDYHLCHARATKIGINCLAVSWGWSDGIIVIYRRIQGFSEEIEWDAVALVTPTGAVLSNLQSVEDVFLQQDETGTLSSQMVRVTGTKSLLIENPSGDKVATLAVSRLGGYVEFIPLESKVWQGPILTPRSHKIATRRSQGRSGSKHYAIGHVVNIVSGLETGICALTLEEHLVDVLNIEVHHTPVSASTEWDKNAFPNFPPAEYLLVACGSAESGEELVTFWSISTIFSTNSRDRGLSLLVNFLGQRAIGSIGNSTIFANDSIMDLWRKPRQVKRRKFNSAEKIQQEHTTRGTISVSTPIVSISFKIFQKETLMLAILDHNHGVSLWDCTNSLRQASQILPSEERELFDPTSNAIVVQNRVDLQQLLKAKMISCMKWTSRGELILATCSNCLHLLKINPDFTLTASPDMLLPKWAGRVTILSTHEKVILLLPKKSGEILVTAELQTSDPTAIVSGLLNSGLYNEAIDAANNFPDKDSLCEVVTTCHKRLWEEKCLLEHLAQVPDHKYVIEQLLSMFRDRKQIPVSMLPNCEAIRHACHLGLSRCANLQVASTLQLTEDIDTVKEKLMDWSTRIGTYSILCKHFGMKEDSTIFFERFCGGNIVALASEIAARGDINSLTLILTRQHRDFGLERWNVLNNIPPSVEPVLYSHLLPVYYNGNVSTEYFLTGDADKGVRQISSLVIVAEEDLGIRIMLEDEEATKLFSTTTTTTTTTEGLAQGDIPISNMISWLVQRAKQIQRVVGTFPILSSFCNLALRCLGTMASEAEASIQELVAFQAFIQHMDQVTYARCLSVPNDESLLQVTTDDLVHMPLSNLLTFFLGEPRNDFEASSRFREHVLPVVSMPVISTSLVTENGSSLDETLDRAVVSHFINLLKLKVLEDKTLSAAHNSLRACVAIAKASRSSLKKSQRIIKERRSLINFVLSLCQAISCCSYQAESSAQELRGIVNDLWEAFESLPSHLGPDEELIEECVELNKKVDILYQRLVVADILVYWSPSNALQLLSGVEVKSNEIASSMCLSFCSHIQNHNEGLRTLHELASDLNQLRIIAYPSYDHLGSTLIDTLLLKLLQLSEFELFAEVFSTILSEVINWERVELTVVSFIQNSIFNDQQDYETNFLSTEDKTEAVVKCQNILGSRLPQLQETLDEICQNLNASYFITSVLCFDHISFSPSALCDMLPFDVIEYVLTENPESILHGCKDWSDAEFGQAKLRELVSLHFRQGAATKSHNAFPGHAIMKLANILGFKTLNCELVIQNRIVHHAQKTAYPWIAVAVVLTMINDTDGQNDDNGILIDTVCQIVDDDNYKDFVIKAILCRLVLNKSTGSWSKTHDGVLKSFAALEHQISRFCPGNWPAVIKKDSTQGNEDSGKSEFAVFRAAGMLARAMVDESSDKKMPNRFGQFFAVRPIDRVFQDTLRDYSSDLNVMFQILQAKASRCEGDDHLVVALGRLYVFWCISNSVREFEQDSRRQFEQDDAFQNLLLAVSLLLCSSDSDAILSNVAEMKAIAEAQSVAAFEQIAANPRQNPVRPDLAIVQKMVELGYPENGARRAAVMTNNESQQAAMVWAVAHSVDSDFDSPLVFVRTLKDLNIDQVAVHNVKRCLFLVESCVNDSGTFSSTLPKDMPNTFSEEELQSMPPCNLTTVKSNQDVPTPSEKITQESKDEVKETTRGSSSFKNEPNSLKEGSLVNDEAEKVECIRSIPLQDLGFSKFQPNQEVQRDIQNIPSEPKKYAEPMQPSSSKHVSKEKPGVNVDKNRFEAVEKEAFLPSLSRNLVDANGETDKTRLITRDVGLQTSPLTDQNTLKLDNNEKSEKTKLVHGHLPNDKQRTNLPTPVVNIVPDKRAVPPIPKKNEAVDMKLRDEMMKKPCKPPPPPSSLPLPLSPGINSKNTPSAPKSSEGVKPRLHLLRTGEDIRQKSRGFSNRLGNEERERLLKKGRQLLEHAKSRRGVVSITGAPSSEPPSKYAARAGNEVTAPTNLDQKLAAVSSPTLNRNLALPLNRDNEDSIDDTAGKLTQNTKVANKSIPLPAQKSEGWDFDVEGDALDTSNGWDFDDF